MQERVTLEQLERAEQAMRDGEPTAAGFHFAPCLACDNLTAVDEQGVCVQCAPDREALAMYAEAEWLDWCWVAARVAAISIAVVGLAFIAALMLGWW